MERIREYVQTHRGCTEDEVAEALVIHIFDALEGLRQLEKRGRLRSEPL